MIRRFHADSFMAVKIIASPVSLPVTSFIYLGILRLTIGKHLQVLKSFLTANTGLQSRLLSIISIYKYRREDILRKVSLLSTAKELRNATLNSLCLSVRPSVCTRHLYSHRTDIGDFNELSVSIKCGQVLD